MKLRMQSSDLIEDQRGVTLLMVLVVSVLLVVLGLSLTVSSMTEFSMSHELQNKKIASLTASGGFASVVNTLEGETLDDLLSDATDVPKYINYSVPTPGSDAEIYFNRNPIAPMEAMNVDFDNPPTQIATRSVNGLLTSASGETLPSGGRYWAKLTDNDDGDSDLTTDQDGKVYLRVLAVRRLGAGQISTFGGTVKNTVSILEAALKLDGTFNVTAPLSFVAPDLDTTVEDNVNWDIHGYDHPAMDLNDLIIDNHSHTTGGTHAGINLVYDNTPTDAQTARSTLYSDLSSIQKGNIVGDVSDYGDTSVQDATQDIRDDPDPDVQQIFDPVYVSNLLARIATIADVTVTDGEISTGDLGTESNPRITYCWGTCSVSDGNSAQGAGLLVIDGASSGEFDIEGQLSFRGLILVNAQELDFDDDGEVRVLGAMVSTLTDGTAYGDPRLEVDDEMQPTRLYYQRSGIQLALNLLPLKTQSWREITHEVEPAF